jgi:hypothetical protein
MVPFDATPTRRTKSGGVSVGRRLILNWNLHILENLIEIIVTVLSFFVHLITVLISVRFPGAYGKGLTSPGSHRSAVQA